MSIILKFPVKIRSLEGQSLILSLYFPFCSLLVYKDRHKFLHIVKQAGEEHLEQILVNGGNQEGLEIFFSFYYIAEEEGAPYVLEDYPSFG